MVGLLNMNNSAKKSTFYYFLRVSEDATATQIKAAYRQIMAENHPDMTTGMTANEKQRAKRRCREAQQAFDVIGNAPARLRYDALLAAYRAQKRESAKSAAKAKRDEKRSAKRAAAAKVVADDGKEHPDWPKGAGSWSTPILSDIAIDTGDSKRKKRPRVASTIIAMACGFGIAYAATLWSLIKTVDILLS